MLVKANIKKVMEGCALLFSYTLHFSYLQSTNSVNYVQGLICEGAANFGASTSGYTCSYHVAIIIILLLLIIIIILNNFFKLLRSLLTI